MDEHRNGLRDICVDCSRRAHTCFCDLSPKSISALESVKISNTYSSGSMLFVEGQPASGLYMLCHGEVKLQTSSPDGKVVILHVARPGELIGLSAIVSGDVYEVSAEVIEPCRVNYISRSDFFRLVQAYPDIAMSTIRQLAARYVGTCNQIRSIVLSNSVSDKLAKLLLDWSTMAVSANDGDDRIRLKMRFTHEEIAEMIGTSRETVTRLLKDFRERDLISLKGSDLYIHSKKGLEMIIGRPRASRKRM